MSAVRAEMMGVTALTSDPRGFYPPVSAGCDRSERAGREHPRERFGSTPDAQKPASYSPAGASTGLSVGDGAKPRLKTFSVIVRGTRNCWR